MPVVTVAEVDALRREGEATLPRRDATENRLHSLSEVLALMIHEWRHHGADQKQLLHDIELIVRSTDQDREAIRQARDTLAGLRYDAAILRLLTQLARRARPKRDYRADRRAERRSSVIERLQRSDARDQVDHASLVMWQQPKRRRTRRY
jgi:hypothetical protein